MHHKRQLRTGPIVARRRPRILLVDDDLVLCVFHAEVLSGAGFDVDMAEDGEAGWQALQVRNYDLLITDNQMPRVSGIELLKKLRSEEQDIPVIMVSGAIPTEELNRNSWLRLSATLPKPFTGDRLLRIVKKVLSETQSTRKQIEHLPARQSAPEGHLV